MLKLSLITLLLAGAAHAAPLFEMQQVDHPAIASIERYTLQSPSSENIAYHGEFASAFPQGFSFAPGSGLGFKKMDRDGTLYFWATGDRGPNGDAPKVLVGDKKREAKFFLAPDYAPRFAEIKVRRQRSADVISSKPFLIDGQVASGLPLPQGRVGATGEVALSDTLKTLDASPRGIDPEGIVAGKKGQLWVVDEYGPFLLQVDAASGKVLKQLAPGAGLPDVLKHRQANRGFEAVAFTPNGKVYAMLQSTLNIDGETKSSAQFIRLVEFDPSSGATRTLAYPLDVDAYKKTGDAKIGDLVAIDNTHFALIEQGKGKDKQLRNVLYVIDIAGADTLAPIAGKEPEYASKADLANVKMIRKQRVLDLRELGWQAEKAESLALYNGGIAIMNDNDFGLKTELASGKDVDDVVIDNGQLPNNERLVVKPSNEATDLWLLNLKQPLSHYYPK
ncbi:esterase-like activity of phytase family protein [uncultured Deefgea sp.]|uniref:esterase-like activity of phytase family protein n=1 Tax=uncultured Deefgea sp. TaxID=1304914 RepID=UPI002594D4E6|nr:esterase-like activity of phytase family protein [uncultured Deefgea sp.]